MSNTQTESKLRIHKLPFIIKKDSLKPSLNSKYPGVFRCFPDASGSLIKEDLIYKATECDFFKGKYPDLIIINRFDLAKNSSRTFASYNGCNGSVVKLTSDKVVKLIGQVNYDQVFASLCSVIHQELKIKGILSLLCVGDLQQKHYSTAGTQTYDSLFTDLMKEKQRLRSKCNRRSRVRPYVVHAKPDDGPRRIVIHPEDLNKNAKFKKDECDTQTVPVSKSNCEDIKLEIIDDKTDYNTADDCMTLSESNFIPDRKQILDEDSNISDVGSIGNLSLDSNFSVSDIVRKAKPLLDYIDDHTDFGDHDTQVAMSVITMADRSTVMVRGNPDLFHIATPDILKYVPPTDQKKLVLHQAYIDWTLCLQCDEDKNCPIHLAVLNKDVELLKRQCSVLKTRHESVDILGEGNLTALQMSIFQDSPECTAVLLAQGADILVCDKESRNVLHLAAEAGELHVAAILTHCRNNAREILKNSEGLWKLELENKPDSKLANYLLTKLSATCDNQGYTPLMLASKLGEAAVVELLASAVPSTINMGMPTCGNTAIYLAVAAACTEAANRGDKTRVPDNFRSTIENLILHSADPYIENSSGSNVTSLLVDCHDTTLNYLIASKLSTFNCGGKTSPGPCMIVKEKEGICIVKDVKTSNSHVNYKKAPKKAEGTPIKNIKANTSANKIKINVKLDIKNDEAKKTIFDKPSESAVNNTSPNETDKPLILKNLPVITKIVSRYKKKTLLVKNFVVKDINNKGLNTQITTKCNISNVKAPPKDHVSKFLTILPKPPPESLISGIVPKNVTQTMMVKSATQTVPQYVRHPVSSFVIDSDKMISSIKKKPIILKPVAIKRLQYDKDESPPSSSKIRKT